MSCKECTAAKIRTDWPIYRAHCQGCAIRSLANSPQYHHGGLDGGNAAPYRKLLAAIFGTDWRNGHALVQAEHKRIREGRVLL